MACSCDPSKTRPLCGNMPWVVGPWEQGLVGRVIAKIIRWSLPAIVN